MAMSKGEVSISGMEVFIVFTEKGYFALVQFSDGAPTVPELVPLVVQGRSISFVTNLPNGVKGRFDGDVTQSGLRGKFVDMGEPFLLPKRRSYWQ